MCPALVVKYFLYIYGCLVVSGLAFWGLLQGILAAKSFGWGGPKAKAKAAQVT